MSDHAVFCSRYYTYPPIILWSRTSDQLNCTLSVTVFPLRCCTPNFEGNPLYWKQCQAACPAREYSTYWSVLLGATISDVPYLTQVNISCVKQHGLITTQTLQWLSWLTNEIFLNFLFKNFQRFDWLSIFFFPWNFSFVDRNGLCWPGFLFLAVCLFARCFGYARACFFDCFWKKCLLGDFFFFLFFLLTFWIS